MIHDGRRALVEEERAPSVATWVFQSSATE